MKKKILVFFWILSFFYFFLLKITLSVSNNNFVTPAASQIGRTENFCENLTLSSDVLDVGGTINFKASANTSDIKKFTFEFFNIDNRLNNKPKAIRFSGDKPFKKVINLGVTQKEATVSVTFSEINKPDLNWNYYMPRPKNIWVEVYFTNSNNKSSKYDSKCAKKFVSKAIDPTPTINVNCKCTTNNSCSTVCFFDKFSGISYFSPRKCKVINGIYKSNPSDNQKTNWCRYYLLSKGDANGNGKINFVDYFYYVQVKSGGKVPQSVNIDFDGNGIVDSKDRNIIIKSLK